MSMTPAEARMLQQLRDDVDRLVANGRADSRAAQARDDGTTRRRITQTAHGFVRSKAVYLDDVDGLWKLINGTSFTYEDYVWGIVSFVPGPNAFSVILAGECRIPAGGLMPGAPYEFNASGDLVLSTARIVVKAISADRVLIGAGVGSSAGSISVDITHTAHGFSVGTFLYRDDTTGLHAKTDNTDPLKCDVRGFVSAVIDANNYTLTLEGWKIGVGASTATLYLSTNGALTTTAPTSGAIIPVLYPVNRSGSFDAYFQAINTASRKGKSCSLLGRSANTDGMIADIQADANGKIPNRIGDAIIWTNSPQFIRSGVTFDGCDVNTFTTSTTPPSSSGKKGEMYFIY